MKSHYYIILYLQPKVSWAYSSREEEQGNVAGYFIKDCLLLEEICSLISY